jgi:hypothetical protein
VIRWGKALDQRAGEPLPGVGGDAQSYAVAVGGVPYQDRSMVAGGLYALAAVRV